MSTVQCFPPKGRYVISVTSSATVHRLEIAFSEDVLPDAEFPNFLDRVLLG
jgi:hypothetical protein